MSYQLLTKSGGRMSPPEAEAILKLQEMLSFARPHGSKAEKGFIKRYISPLDGVLVDKAGNRTIIIDKPDGEPSRVLWSSHTDTVHRRGGRQIVERDGPVLQLARGETASCLGADCTTGVWLMLEMIAARVPGRYVFHRAEEIGGWGSQWIAKHRASVLEQYDFAIAFDRRGKSSVITHQGSRCASDAFAESMAAMLPPGYAADDTGTFTDTANYTDHVGECSNISVGYENAHSSRETQCIFAALDLRAAMLAFDESRLVAERKAGEIDPLDYHYGSWGRYSALDGFVDYRDELKAANANVRPLTMGRFVEEHTDLIVALLEEHGYGIEDLNDLYDSYYGRGATN